MARFDIDFDDRDMTHMTHNRIEDAHVRIIFGGQGRDRVVIDVSRIQAARQVHISGQIEPEIMRRIGKFRDGQALVRRAFERDRAIFNFKIGSVRLH